jgi:septal ring factor EnvC (AmiA/AmiB activator)
MWYNSNMQEKLESKREQVKAKFDQVSKQIERLQHDQMELRGAYSVLEELINDSKDDKSEES